jgi:hypothetical protein
VLPARFLIVAGFAETLEISNVPKQFLVAAMVDNVVSNL